MAGNGTITVGHHVYTAVDARGTVEDLARIWEHHVHDSSVPEGWLAGARGFVAETTALAGVKLPSLDDLDSAFSALGKACIERYDDMTADQIESLLAAMWRFFPTMRMLDHEYAGTVEHMHASRGLPKKPIDGGRIGFGGLEGDVQTWRKGHGRPWQALCIWSTDAIETLQHEGHPIDHGFAGENLTISGIPSAAFRPGAQFRIGTVRGFMTAYAIPCRQNKDWFVDGDFRRMSHERGDHSRLYAMVVTPGEVRVGDRFELYTDR